MKSKGKKKLKVKNTFAKRGYFFALIIAGILGISSVSFLGLELNSEELFFAATTQNLKKSPKNPKASIVKSLFDENVTSSKKHSIEDSVKKKVGVKRAKAVKFSKDGFVDKVLPNGKVKIKRRLDLNLFPDKKFSAVQKNVKEKSSGHIVWKGSLAEDPLAMVHFVMKGDMVLGSVHSASLGAYEIYYEGDGIHSIREIDYNAFPRDIHLASTTPKPKRANAKTTLTKKTSASVATNIDVLMAYSRGFREWSDDQLQAHAELRIAEANEIFSNSAIRINLRLAGAPYRTNYTAAGDVHTDLDRLFETNDTFLDDIPAVRDSRAADVTFLYVGSSDASACGVAYIMNRDNWDYFDWYAYAVGDGVCDGTFVFTHELGHILGAHHDRDNSEGTIPPYDTYSYGYQNRDRSVRTVMSYRCPEQRNPNGCVLVPYFSTPLILYSPYNITIGTETENNAKTLNETRRIVESFRSSGINIPMIHIPLLLDR